MAAVDPVDATYTPNLPRATITDGKVSSAQIEAIIYAGQAHQQTLPDGSRRGFLIGDGTGVGKGREIAAIILDNQRQGRKKHIWISAKSGLFNDAKRDFTGAGANADDLFELSKTKPGETVKHKSGVMFTTYDTLRGTAKITPEQRSVGVKAATRLDQIVKWLGEDFNGVLVFDEAHNMGNVSGKKGARGVTQGSQKAFAGVELQNKLPQARIVYVSATAATEVDNLMYGTRLGLWGEGTAFPNSKSFAAQIGAAGIASMELVARDMKAQGVYIARALSYDGVEQERIDIPLTPLQTDIYDELAKAWQIVLQNINAALADTEQEKDGQAKGRALSRFWGTHQRFFNQVITSMQTPEILARAKKEIDNGNTVVFQLVNTNEATQERLVERAEANDTPLEELDFTPRETLIEYVRTAYPIEQYEEYTDDEGKVRSRPAKDSEWNAVINKDAVRARDSLLKTLADIRVPDNPLDLIVEALGSENVAEVTGRGRRFVKVLDEDGGFKITEQKRGKNSNAADAQAFMDDRKKALIFSDAGGTGYSFQSDLGVKNQRRRVHFLVQPGWRADNAVQGFGRTHRSNEANQPIYILATTNLKAQRRFISSIARRLDQLGALTKGQRNTSSQGLFTNRDNLESTYATAAVRSLIEDMFGAREGLTGNEVLDKAKVLFAAMGLDNLSDADGKLNQNAIPEVPRFLNRLLSLTVEWQNKVFGEFESRLDATIDAAIERGTYDDGMQTLRALKIEKERDEVVYTDERTKATTRYVELKITNPTTLNDWNAIQVMQEAYPGKDMQYFLDNRSNQPFAVIDMGSRVGADGAMQHRGYRFNVKAPGQAVRGVYITNLDSIQKGGRAIVKEKEDGSEDRIKRYDQLEPDVAATLWTLAFEKAPLTDSKQLHILTGTLLPVWDRIKTDESVSVVRTQTDDGERLIGRVLADKSRQKILKNLGVGALKADIPAAELVRRIMDGETAHLSNDWRIQMARVANEKRLELNTSYLSVADQELLKTQGAFVERIGWRERVFIPTNDDYTAFERITRGSNRPVIEFSGKGGETATGAFSRGTGKGTDAATIRQTVKSITAKWANAPEIIVVNSMQDERVPESVRGEDAKQRSQGASGEPEGFFYEGKVYLIAEGLGSTRDAVRTLFHEALGHAGLRGVFGDRLDGILDDVSKSMPDRVEAKAKQYGLDFYNVEDRRIAAEEVLAALAQDKPHAGLVRRAIAAIRQFLRDLGIDLNLSDNDIIAQYILPAREFVEQGGDANGGVGGAFFARRIFFDGYRTARDFIVPETPAYEGNMTGDLARIPESAAIRGVEAIPIRLPVGIAHGPHAGYGITHMQDNADREGRRNPPAATDDRAENFARHIIDVLRDSRQIFVEGSGRVIFRSIGMREAVIGRRMESRDGPYYSIVTIVPSERPVWGTPVWVGRLTFPTIGLRQPVAPGAVVGQEFAATNLGRAGVQTEKFDFTKKEPTIQYKPKPRFSRSGDLAAAAREEVGNLFQSQRTFNWWHRTVGTQFHKAQVDSDFKRVFDLGQDYLTDTSRFSMQSESLAPDILLRMEGVRDILKFGISKKDKEAIARPIFEGTLNDKLYSAAELGAMGLTDKQIGLYDQFREATNNSLDGLAKSTIAKMAKAVGVDIGAALQIREKGISEFHDDLLEMIEDRHTALEGAIEALGAGDPQIGLLTERAKQADQQAKAITKLFNRIEKLKSEGYAPLVRFGEYTVYASKDNGKEQVYFGMYETQRAANVAAKALREEYPDADVTQGILSKEAWRIFQGLSPDTIEVFARAAGLESEPLFQEYLKLAVNNRSAMKRLIQRKGTAGFSEDVPRVLASFVTSNARLSSSNWHLGEMQKAVDAIPKEKGDVKDEAVRLWKYLTDPQEEAGALRGFLFFNFLGGSIASAMVNATQPVTMTAPYLVKYASAAKVSAQLARAGMEAAKNKPGADVAQAYKRAVDDGIVAPHEIYQLIAQARGSVIGSTGLHRLMKVWGSFFSLAEAFNRRTTFIAAYRIAVENETPRPYEFAKQAVSDTQGLYNRGNRPDWARGPVGATVFTFKQFSISYVEFLKRLHDTDKKAFWMAIAVLALASGGEGLPFAEDIEDVLDTIGQWLGYSTNSKKWLKDRAAEALGEDAGQFVLHGISAIPGMPLDVSQRMGMHNLIPGTSLLKKSDAKNQLREATEVLGPAGGLLQNAARAFQGGTVVPLLPTAIQNLYKGGQMWVKGYYEDSKGKRVIDTTGGEAILKAAGFQPASVAAESRKIGMARQDIELVKSTESGIADKWASGIVEKDQDQVESAKQELRDWNAKNPSSPIRIESQQIRRRVLEMRKSRAQRFIRSAPPEMRGQVAREIR